MASNGQFWQLLQHHRDPSCTDSSFPWSLWWCGEGEHAAWVIACFPKFQPRHHVERTLHLPFAASNTTREASVTCIKSVLNWRRAKRQGMPLTVGGIIASHWVANARLKLAAPSQLVATPPRSVYLIGCVGLRSKAD